MSDVLLTDRSDGVLWLTLNRPRARNALSVELLNDLRDTLGGAAAQADVRTVVLRGAEGMFCAGGDVKEMNSSAAAVVAKMSAGRDIVQLIAGLRKPVVAAVQGYAAGAGMSLALACDLVVADASAVFTAAYSEVGLVPDLAGTYWLARQVGIYRAKDIFLSGRGLPAEEADRLGLLARVWPTEEFEAELVTFATRLAQGPTVSFGATKQLLNRSFETDLSSALEMETTSQVYSALSADHQRAIEAWRRKERPVFQGD